jgi:prevent-host-death family protein
MKNSPSNEVGAYDAKNTQCSLLDREEQGYEIVITRHGRPVARLVPSDSHSSHDEVQAAFDQLRQRARQLARKKRNAQPFGWEEMKKLRDQGRP